MTRPSAADAWGIAALVMLLGSAHGMTARPGQALQRLAPALASVA